MNRGPVQRVSMERGGLVQSVSVGCGPVQTGVVQFRECPAIMVQFRECQAIMVQFGGCQQGKV